MSSYAGITKPGLRINKIPPNTYPAFIFPESQQHYDYVYVLTHSVCVNIISIDIVISTIYDILH